MMTTSLCRTLAPLLLCMVLAPIAWRAAPAGELAAAPWKHVVEAGDHPDALDMENLPALAEQGSAYAAAKLGDAFRSRQDNQAIHWFRMAVKNGDVGSAFSLGDLYFPLGGSLGRENFASAPDVVLGYVWYAIALSGYAAAGENAGERIEAKRREAQQAADAVRRLLLPSERDQAAAILAEWPEALPPASPFKPLSRPRDTGTPHGLDMTADMSALPAIKTKAEAGDVQAMALFAAMSLEQGDEERALHYATRAAEKGHSLAMVLLSKILRERDEYSQAMEWLEKAAAAGEQSALREMLRSAETSGDGRKIIFWLTVNMLRTPDPAAASHCRLLIAYAGHDMEEHDIQEAMGAGERWHREHPVCEEDRR